MAADHDPYTFVKGADFFGPCHEWPTLTQVLAHSWDGEAFTLTLTLQRPDSPQPSALQLLVLQSNLFRVRINPGKRSANDYTAAHTRAVVQDTVDDLRGILAERFPFSVAITEPAPGQLVLTTMPKAGGGSIHSEIRPAMRVVIDIEPQLRISVFDLSASDAAPPVWRSAGIRFLPVGDNDDFRIIQAVEKPPTALYAGFGEHGEALFKQAAQLVYFNYDNMRYRQVYNEGALDHREPLYHSDPFFVAFNSSPGVDSCYGVFVDNAGQVCIDVGHRFRNKYQLGCCFNDLDYYLIFGSEPAQVLTDYTALVGRPRLRPRYALGYHQGCFGYRDRKTLEVVVDAYRRHNIPLDGLAIDVDIQQAYKTFTVDESKFDNPKEMFASLKAKGVKCCTNITPIISMERADNYSTYQEGLSRGFFVTDKRHEPDSPASKSAEFYSAAAKQVIPFDSWDERSQSNYNSGEPYIGQVWYGGDQKTAGHYPDFAVKEVREWWGKQYQHLFDLGLEFVWQDMTTPAIPVLNDTTPFGDMKGFPYRLIVTDDFLSGASKQPEPRKTLAVKVWNLYSYNLHKATHNGLNHLSGRENTRNFIIGRGCYSGMHRFAALWTGDNESDWPFLQIYVAQVLSLGMCGQALSGQDIGGFESRGGEEWADPALLIRWTIAGAFLPWFRNHYNGNSKLFQEPFNYEEWFETDEARRRGFSGPPAPADLYLKVIPICRHFISLRYRLLQLFYDQMFQNMLDGMPICRPLFLTDPSDNALFNQQVERCSDQFVVGKDLLVAPVLEPETLKGGVRPVYLPRASSSDPGRWYCFMDSSLPLEPPLAGGSTISCNASLGFDLQREPLRLRFLCPLYVREGGVLPTIPQEQFVGQLNSEGKPCPLTFNVYPGRAGSYDCFLDDGVSRSSAPADAPQFAFGEETRLGIARSEYRHTRLQHILAPDGQTRIITAQRLHDGFTPKLERHFYIALLHDPAEASGGAGGSPLLAVSVGGAEISRVVAASGRAALEAAAGNAWWFDGAANVSYIKVLDDAQVIQVAAKYAERVPWASRFRSARKPVLLPLPRRAKIPARPAVKVYSAVQKL